MDSINGENKHDDLDLGTFATTFIEDIEDRWKEIDLLIDQIKQQSKDDVKNVLCRSTVVLLVAHLEGFIKEAASVLIKDLNQHIKFSEMPKSIQKTYCTYFLTIDNNGSTNNDLQGKLLEEFNKLNAKLIVAPFLFDRNKNPSPTIIEKILSNFGVKDFFRLINKSKLNIVFENNHSDTSKLLSELRKYTKNSIVSYPYKIELDKYELLIKEEKLKREDSLWIVFIDELLRKRHSIAHGSSFQNDIAVAELEDAKIKVQILQYGIALVLLHSGVVKDKAR